MCGSVLLGLVAAALRRAAVVALRPAWLLDATAEGGGEGVQAAAKEEEETRGVRGGGRFAVDARLDAGSFGEVYLCFDRARGGPCVGKRLRASLAHCALFEARVMRLLAHPRIVRCVAVVGGGGGGEGGGEGEGGGGGGEGEGAYADDAGFHAWLHDPRMATAEDGACKVATAEAGEVWVFMQHGGRPLVDVLTSERVDAEREHRLATELVEAVAHCHRCGVAHMDLKLENAVVSHEDGSLRLVDFGFAQRCEAGAWSTRGCGSQHYAAPEVVDVCAAGGRGDGVLAYDALQADAWSLGVCLFAILFRVLPFGEASLRCERFRFFVARQGGGGEACLDLARACGCERAGQRCGLPLEVLDALLRVHPDRRMRAVQAMHCARVLTAWKEAEEAKRRGHEG